MITMNQVFLRIISATLAIGLLSACAQTPQRAYARSGNDKLYCAKEQNRTAKACQYQQVVARRKTDENLANKTLRGLPKHYSNSSARQQSKPSAKTQQPPRLAKQTKPVIPKAPAAAKSSLPVASHVNFWPRLSEQLSFYELADKDAIDDREEWYSKHPYYLNTISKRASRYIYYILENIEERGMPADLALLPFVESSYDPFAYSHGHAAGLWQFVPNTAKHMGITQNWWYDGRRDVITATDAALDYLTELNRRFDGDWLLTLAAYNSGASTVNKAIRKNKAKGLPTDFWSLKLPKETRNYIPKLLALVNIYKNPASYNVSLPALPNRDHFVSVDTGSQIDLAQAAKLAEISVDELYRLNPGYNRWVTAPEGPHRLLVPVEKAKQFSNRLEKIEPQNRVRWQRYSVQRGDNLIAISRRHHVDVATLRASNQLDKDVLKIGQVLLIPDAGNGVSPLKGINRRVASNGASRQEYTIVSGDTLSAIANKYGVDSKQISSWNKLKQSSVIRPGQKLIVWAKTSKNSGQAIIRKVGYKVRSGDSLSLIASRFNLRIRDIAEWNSLKTSQYLRPGQSLTLYVDITHADL